MQLAKQLDFQLFTATAEFTMLPCENVVRVGLNEIQQ